MNVDMDLDRRLSLAQLNEMRKSSTMSGDISQTDISELDSKQNSKSVEDAHADIAVSSQEKHLQANGFENYIKYEETKVPENENEFTSFYDNGDTGETSKKKMLTESTNPDKDANESYYNPEF